MMLRLLPVLLSALALVACQSVPHTPGADRYGQKYDTAPVGAARAPRTDDPVPVPEPRSRYGNHSPYQVFGVTYHVMDSAEGYVAEGIASWYGSKFHGRRTSSGEPYDMYAMTAAHRQLPLPTYVEVTNLNNGRKVVVRVNDRGPFKKDRIIDLSYAAASRLGMLESGTAPVELRVVTPDTPPQAVTAATDRSGKIAYYIQAGAFGERANADRLRNRLDAADLGVPSRLETVNLNGRRLHRVRLGPLSTISDVDRLSSALARLGLRDAQVVVQD